MNYEKIAAYAKIRKKCEDTHRKKERQGGA